METQKVLAVTHGAEFTAAIAAALDRSEQGKHAVQRLLLAATFAAFREGTATALNELYEAVKARKSAQTDVVCVARWIKAHAPVYLDKESKVLKPSTSKVNALSLGALSHEDALNIFWKWASTQGKDGAPVAPFYMYAKGQARKADAEFGAESLEKALAGLVKKLVGAGMDKAADVLAEAGKKAVVEAKIAAAAHAVAH